MSEPKRVYFETNGVKKSSSEPSAADTRKTIRLELNLSTAESYPQFNYLDLVAAEKVKKKKNDAHRQNRTKKNNHQNELFVCDVDARNEEKSILRYCDGTFLSSRSLTSIFLSLLRFQLSCARYSINSP